jgi:SAM-dependent methyltransferase
MQKNEDIKVVEGFGDEWSRFDQSQLNEHDHQKIFNDYFSIFPWGKLPANSVGFDLGCGSGRWAKLVAQKVGVLHCIDASEAALDVARRNLKHAANCHFHLASVESIPLADGSADFGYSLGVLHHIPDTGAGIAACTSKLKPGAPFLIYLYYAFDNKPWWYRLIWRCSEVGRALISRLPLPARYLVSQIVALLVYLPLARLSLLLQAMGLNVNSVPLSYYREKSFYVMRTDALDRFGTRLEKRFSRVEILEMLQAAGLEDISFSESTPYWCAVGYKK